MPAQGLARAIAAGTVPAHDIHNRTNGTTTRVAPTIGEIIGAFKSITTHGYILGVKQSGWPPFPKNLWQRNHFEHIIRDEEDYERIASYILDNPANWEQDEENPNNPRSDPLHLKTK